MSGGFSLQPTDRIQVIDLNEVQLMVVVDLQNRSMIYGGGRHPMMTVALLRHVANTLEAASTNPPQQPGEPR
jgi:hypothetical protein